MPRRSRRRRHHRHRLRRRLPFHKPPILLPFLFPVKETNVLNDRVHLPTWKSIFAVSKISKSRHTFPLRLYVYEGDTMLFSSLICRKTPHNAYLVRTKHRYNRDLTFYHNISPYIRTRVHCTMRLYRYL